MSRTRKVLGAASIGSVQQAATILVGLWLTPFLLGHVGQNDLGLWMVASQVLGYLALIDLGVLAILPREVAHYAARLNERHEILGLVGHVRALVRRQIIGLIVICVVGLSLMPAEWVGLRGPLTWVFFVFIVAYPLRVPSAVLQGLQHLPFLATAQFSGWAFGTLATVLLVTWGFHLPALVTGWSVTLLLPAIAASWRFRELFGGATPSAHRSGGDYFSRSLWVSAGQFGQVFLNGSDVLIIGRLLGAAAVVPYACTARLVTVLTNYPQLLAHTAQPALVELRWAASKERLISVAQALTQGIIVVSGALVIVIVAVNHFFVTWWVGPAQYAGLTVTLAVAITMLLRHWNVATIYTLFCFGYERQLSLVALIDGIVTLVATIWLVPKFGLLGAPIASLLGLLLVGLPINIKCAAAEMNLSVMGFLAPSLTLAGAIAAVLAVASFASVWLDPNSLVTTAAFALVALSAYAAVVTPFIMFGPLRPYAGVVLAMVVGRKQRDAPATV